MSPDDPASGLEERVAAARAQLRGLRSVAVAFSGGVDSSVLLLLARQELGERAVAVVADSPSLPREELAAARETCAAIGARLVVVHTDELADERYARNAGDRCYWCKSALFEVMAPWAREHGYDALAFGEIADDRRDDRPGARAARERGVVAPLAGLSKDDVRRVAREAGLAVAEKPAMACLASRLPVGTRVTPERLARVERAEQRVRALGFRQVRVRDRGALGGIEVGADELARAEELRGSLAAELAVEGFTAIELAAYVSPPARAR